MFRNINICFGLDSNEVIEDSGSNSVQLSRINPIKGNTN